MSLELNRVVRLTSFAKEERTRPALRYWLSRPLNASRLSNFCGGNTMQLAPGFDEVVGSLSAHGIEFIVVGALALAFR